MSFHALFTACTWPFFSPLCALCPLCSLSSFSFLCAYGVFLLFPLFYKGSMPLLHALSSIHALFLSFRPSWTLHAQHGFPWPGFQIRARCAIILAGDEIASFSSLCTWCALYAPFAHPCPLSLAASVFPCMVLFLCAHSVHHVLFLSFLLFHAPDPDLGSWILDSRSEIWNPDLESGSWIWIPDGSSEHKKSSFLHIIFLCSFYTPIGRPFLFLIRRSPVWALYALSLSILFPCPMYVLFSALFFHAAPSDFHGHRIWIPDLGSGFQIRSQSIFLHGAAGALFLSSAHGACMVHHVRSFFLLICRSPVHCSLSFRPRSFGHHYYALFSALFSSSGNRSSRALSRGRSPCAKYGHFDHLQPVMSCYSLYTACRGPFFLLFRPLCTMHSCALMHHFSILRPIYALLERVYTSFCPLLVFLPLFVHHAAPFFDMPDLVSKCSISRFWTPDPSFSGRALLGALFGPPLCALCTEWPFLCTLSFYKGSMPLLWTVLCFCAFHAQPWILCSQKEVHFWSPHRGCTLILEYTLKVLFLDLFLRALFPSCSYTAVYALFCMFRGLYALFVSFCTPCCPSCFLVHFCSFLYSLFCALFRVLRPPGFW